MKPLRILTGENDPHMPYLHYYYPPRAFRKMGHTVVETGYRLSHFDFAFMQENQGGPPFGYHDYPLGYWAVDNEWHWPHDKNHACKTVDVIFVSEYDWVEKYKEFSEGRVEWLPFGCEPELHKEIEATEIYDIGFVGMYEQHRGRFLDTLRRAGFTMHIHSSREAGLLSWSETCRFMAECRMVFNYSLATGLNMRLYETLSMGKLLLTNRKGSSPDIFFKDGEHLAIYETPEELIEKAKYYLKDENERRRVAKAGQKLVHEKHTYIDRMKFVIKAFLGDQA